MNIEKNSVPFGLQVWVQVSHIVVQFDLFEEQMAGLSWIFNSRDGLVGYDAALTQLRSWVQFPFFVC